MSDITIGFQLVANYGTMPAMRKAWMAAEELGVDRLYTSDHINAIPVDPELIQAANDGSHNNYLKGNIFEATTVQASMASTTQRAEIGCIVHANAYRNPNMLAYIANTIDHISGGRFILGIGTGFAQKDFEDFGYEYGTQTSRSLALERDVPIILDRFTKLTPPGSAARKWAPQHATQPGKACQFSRDFSPLRPSRSRHPAAVGIRA